MTNQPNLEVLQPTKFPTVFIPLIADVFAKVREALIENLPSPDGIEDLNTLSYCSLLYELAEVSLDFLDATQGDFAELLREKGAWEVADANILHRASDAVSKSERIFDNIEILVFGTIVDKSKRDNVAIQTDEELIMRGFGIIYRALRVDAYMYDTSIETEFAALASLITTEPAKLQQLIESGFEGQSATDWFKEIANRLADQKAQEKQKPLAQILLFEGPANG